MPSKVNKSRKSVDKAKPKVNKKSDNVLTVDLDDLGKLAYDGQNVVLEPEAEQALIQLLELQKRVNEAVDNAKSMVEQRALEHNPNFTSVQASKLKVGYQFFGMKYSIDNEHLDDLSQEFYKTETKYSPVSAAIDKYVKDEGKLPLGIIERERSKTITIKPIKDFSEAEE